MRIAANRDVWKGKGKYDDDVDLGQRIFEMNVLIEVIYNIYKLQENSNNARETMY